MLLTAAVKAWERAEMVQNSCRSTVTFLQLHVLVVSQHRVRISALLSSQVWEKGVTVWEWEKMTMTASQREKAR
jgi:ribosomal protein L31E